MRKVYTYLQGAMTPPLYEFQQKSMRAHRERRHLCHSIWALLSSRAATTIPTRHVVSLTSQIWRFPSTTATTHSWSCIPTPPTPPDSQASVQSSLTNRAGHGSCRRRQFPKVSFVAWRMRLRLPSKKRRVRVFAGVSQGRVVIFEYILFWR